MQPVSEFHLFVAESHFIEGIDHVSCIRLLQVSQSLSPLRLPRPVPPEASTPAWSRCVSSHLRVFRWVGRSSSFLHLATPFTLAALSSQLIFTSKLFISLFSALFLIPLSFPVPCSRLPASPVHAGKDSGLSGRFPAAARAWLLARSVDGAHHHPRSDAPALASSTPHVSPASPTAPRPWPFACLLVRLSPSPPTRALSLTAGGPCRVVTSRLQVAASFPGPGRSLLGSLRVTLGAGCVVHSGSLPAQLGDSGPPRAGHAGLTSE